VPRGETGEKEGIIVPEEEKKPEEKPEEEEEPEEVTSMICGPLEWSWGTVQAGISVVRITTDGGGTWTWGVATGTITIPVGGPLSWDWEEHTFKGE
jgi:hypothetical protein